jgi:CDP-diacylglycerol--glycerol-3-phosphate 3-phosphatidyltransferase
MALTRKIGDACSYVLGCIVRLLIGTRVHPNVLTSVGLAINTVAAWLFSRGEFFSAGVVVLCGAVFDLVDGPVARESSRVTRFGGFLDSVLDRYSDLILLMGLLVYYASIDRFFYIVLTAVVMTGSVMVSYTRARAENTIASCKVGFLERPERIVLIIIGAFSGRMAQVLWVIAVLSNITVIHRIITPGAKPASWTPRPPARLPPREADRTKASRPRSRNLPRDGCAKVILRACEADGL